MFFQRTLGVTAKKFFQDLYHEIQEDDIFTGAAALTFYLLLSVFPAMIFLLSLLPYLPVENLDMAIMNFINEILPTETATMFSGVVTEITSQRSSGLVSFGVLATIWAASSGMVAIMDQLNHTYDVGEARSFWRSRGVAILLTFVFGLLVIGAFALIVLGGFLQEYLATKLGFESAWLFVFSVLRWVIIMGFMLLGFALIYYYGPNVKQDFRFITPGSVLGVILLFVASMAFRAYIENFADYAATYGSIGAVIILMLWLYMIGVVILLGSEVNALIEH